MVVQRELRDRWPRRSLAAGPARRTRRASRARARAGAAPAAADSAGGEPVRAGTEAQRRGAVGIGHARTRRGCRRLTGRALARAAADGGRRGRRRPAGVVVGGVTGCAVSARVACARGRLRRGIRRAQPSAPQARACGTTGCNPASRSSPGLPRPARIAIADDRGSRPDVARDGRVAERREDGVPLRRARRPRRRLRRAPAPERIKELAHWVMRRASA